MEGVKGATDKTRKFHSPKPECPPDNAVISLWRKELYLKLSMKLNQYCDEF